MYKQALLGNLGVEYLNKKTGDPKGKFHNFVREKIPLVNNVSKAWEIANNPETAGRLQKLETLPDQAEAMVGEGRQLINEGKEALNNPLRHLFKSPEGKALGVGIPALLALPFLYSMFNNRNRNQQQPIVINNQPPTPQPGRTIGPFMSHTPVEKYANLGRLGTTMGLSYLVGDKASREALKEELDEREGPQVFHPQIVTDDPRLKKLLKKPAVRAYIEQLVQNRVL